MFGPGIWWGGFDLNLRPELVRATPSSFQGASGGGHDVLVSDWPRTFLSS